MGRARGEAGLERIAIINYVGYENPFLFLSF